MNKKDDIKRINIRLPEYIQEWYKDQGKKYSVPYSNYMAMILTQVYEEAQKNELAIEFNQTLKDIQSTAGDVTAEQMMIQFKEMQTYLDNKD